MMKIPMQKAFVKWFVNTAMTYYVEDGVEIKKKMGTLLRNWRKFGMVRIIDE